MYPKYSKFKNHILNSDIWTYKCKIVNSHEIEGSIQHLEKDSPPSEDQDYDDPINIMDILTIQKSHDCQILVFTLNWECGYK
jgi:hypothetical protein